PRESYLLKPGEVYLLSVEIQQNTRSEAADSDAITLSSTVDMTFTVDSLKDPDLIYMTVRYKALELTMLAPEMGLEISSGSNLNPLLTGLIDSLERSAFSLVTDARGALLQQRGLAQRFDELARVPVKDTAELDVILQTLREVYGPNAFSSLFGLFISVYPVVRPMTNWTNDITYYFNTRPVEMVNRYTLSRTTDERMIIQGLGMIEAHQQFRERTEMGVVESLVTGTQTYDLQMDRETGWPLKCVSRQRVLIETSIIESSYLPAGLKIPSYTETLFEVNGSRL
ncbi:MAG: DUF6263 family protein, partial [Bacteroidales bacterium]